MRQTYLEGDFKITSITEITGEGQIEISGIAGKNSFKKKIELANIPEIVFFIINKKKTMNSNFTLLKNIYSKYIENNTILELNKKEENLSQENVQEDELLRIYNDMKQIEDSLIKISLVFPIDIIKLTGLIKKIKVLTGFEEAQH